LEEAKAICENHDECTGITLDNGGYEPRSGSVEDATVHVAAHELFVKVPAFTWTKTVCTNGSGTKCNLRNDKDVRAAWSECDTCSPLSKCQECVSNCNNGNGWKRCWRTTLEEAKAICENHDECTGITLDNGGYEPRSGSVEDATVHVAAHELYVKVPAEESDAVLNKDFSLSQSISEISTLSAIILMLALFGLGSVLYRFYRYFGKVHAYNEVPDVAEPTFQA